MATENTPAPSSTLDPEKVRTETAALFEEAHEAHTPSTIVASRGDHTEASVLLVPKGMRAESLKPFLDAYRRLPERPTGTSTHQTLASIIAHASEFKGPGTAAWAHVLPTAATLLVVYDYHRGNTSERSEEPEDSGARWCQFGANYAFPIAPEFTAWREKSGKALSQADMAAFLEDHLAEVCPSDDPGQRTLDLAALLETTVSSASTLLGFARRSAATVNLFVSEKRDPTTGAVSLVYQEEVNHQTEDRAVVVPPGVFAINVPVLQGGEAYRLPVRLKSAVKGRSIQWSFEVYRLDVAVQTAVEEELARFTSESGVRVYRGAYKS